MYTKHLCFVVMSLEYDSPLGLELARRLGSPGPLNGVMQPVTQYTKIRLTCDDKDDQTFLSEMYSPAAKASNDYVTVATNEHER